MTAVAEEEVIDSVVKVPIAHFVCELVEQTPEIAFCGKDVTGSERLAGQTYQMCVMCDEMVNHFTVVMTNKCPTCGQTALAHVR